MTKNQLAIALILFLALAVISGRQFGKIPFDQISASASVSQQPASTDQKAATWDYKILTGHIDSVVKVSYTDNKGRQMTSPGPHLEDEINKLAAQGYVVESFQPVLLVGGAGTAPNFFSLSSSAKIVVLLKRAVK